MSAAITGLQVRVVSVTRMTCFLVLPGLVRQADYSQASADDRHPETLSHSFPLWMSVPHSL